MKSNNPLSMSDYDRPYRAAEKALKKAAEESGNEILEKVSKKDDPKIREKRETNCIKVRKVVDACLDEYRDGEYTFKEALSELKDALEYL